MSQPTTALSPTPALPNASPLPRFVELVRVSTPDQAERDTPEMQRTALDLLRERVPGVRVDRIEALAVSGAAPLSKRTDLQKVFDLLADGAIDEIRVYNLDRITRSENGVERAMIFRALQEARALIRTCDGRVINPAAEGEAGQFAELGFMLDSWMAAQDRRRQRRRMADGRRRGILDGHLVSGSTAYGYRYTVKTKEWSVEPAEAAVVKQIFRWSADGMGLRTIAERLNLEAVKPKRATRWDAGRVEQMLKNSTYKGEQVQRVGTERYTVAVPAIVDPDLWERVQAGFVLRKRKPSRPRTVVEALCRGRAVCACGSPMHVTGSAQGRYRYYNCASTSERSKVPNCGATGHPGALVDAAVWSVISTHLRSPVLIREAAGLTEKPDTSNWEGQVVSAEKTLSKLKREEAGILDLIRDGLLSMEVARERLAGLTRQRNIAGESAEVARRAIAQREAARLALASIEERVGALAGSLDAADFATRRAIVESVVPDLDGCRITLHPDGHISIRGILDLSQPGGNDDRLSEPSSSDVT